MRNPKPGKRPIIKALSHADPAVRDAALKRLALAGRSGLTPVQRASLDGDIELIRALVSQERANPSLRVLSARGAFGFTPAHFAAANGHADLIRLLGEHDPHLLAAPAWHDWTPMHFAANGGYRNVIRTLAGFDMRLLGALTSNGLSVVELANMQGRVEVVREVINLNLLARRRASELAIQQALGDAAAAPQPGIPAVDGPLPLWAPSHLAARALSGCAPAAAASPLHETPWSRGMGADAG